MKLLTFLLFAALSLSCRVDAKDKERGSLTPFGVYPRECIHSVPEGAHIDASSDTHLHITHPDGKQVKILRCKQKATRETKVKGSNGDGWQAYTYLKADNITSFLGKWIVPDDPPQYDDQTVFLFPGLQNINWIPPDPQPSQAFDIIQPVLQYGPSSAGGYDYWAIASWYVTLTDDVVFSPLKQVSSGDTIFGNMTKVGASSWYINTLDSKTGTKSDLTISRTLLATQPWACTCAV
eukprot:TRINITY_DN1561_c0_g1_i4.p2 TRINITY_DN1561_c0_g1~~TRINITY_DN1561_c0_g1_i4.p2  ORF type:complete len:236 (-),score=45.62 TRINITY_DN1561_c0_g1_i4:442-1149(-)